MTFRTSQKDGENASIRNIDSPASRSIARSMPMPSSCQTLMLINQGSRYHWSLIFPRHVVEVELLSDSWEYSKAAVFLIFFNIICKSDRRKEKNKKEPPKNNAREGTSGSSLLRAGNCRKKFFSRFDIKSRTLVSFEIYCYGLSGKREKSQKCLRRFRLLIEKWNLSIGEISSGKAELHWKKKNW